MTYNLLSTILLVVIVVSFIDEKNVQALNQQSFEENYLLVPQENYDDFMLQLPEMLVTSEFAENIQDFDQIDIESQDEK